MLWLYIGGKSSWVPDERKRQSGKEGDQEEGDVEEEKEEQDYVFRLIVNVFCFFPFSRG